MDDQQRLELFRQRLDLLGGLDESRFQRLCAELARPRSMPADEQQGRPHLTMFDAKSYDIQSFEEANRGRWDLRYVSAALDQHTARAADGSRAICVFVNDTCDKLVIETLASMGVELIALRCAGFNNLDIEACRRAGISAVRVPAYSPHAVAEHTVALMLMLNRRLHVAYQRNRAGDFVLDGLTGFDMQGKTAGVVGTGQIGRCVINILLGFGCRVLAFDRFPDQQLSTRANVSYVDLDKLLRESDIISLHVPLFAETHHLINAAAIQRMKPGVMLINTSRGGLVDTPALIDGLKSGRIGLAGLDVYEEEAGIFFHDISSQVLTDDVLARLLTFNNVVVTSHQGFLTREALANIAHTTLANLEEFHAGKRGTELTHAVL